MLPRFVLALSHRKLSFKRFPRQMSPFVHPRREFSSGRQHDVPPGPGGSTSKPPESGRNLSKVLIGGVAIGTCFIAAYSPGYLDDILGRREQSSTDPSESGADYRKTENLPKGEGGLYDSENIKESVTLRSGNDSKSVSSDAEDSKESSERRSVLDPLEDTHKLEADHQISAADSSHLKPKEESSHVKEDLAKNDNNAYVEGENFPKSSPKETAEDESLKYKEVEDTVDKESSGQKTGILPKVNNTGVAVQRNNMNEDVPVELKSEDETKDVQDHAQEPSTSLLDAYSLRDKMDESVSTSSEHIVKHPSSREKTSLGAFEDLSDAYVSNDGKLILDFLQAIHAAEQRQAELDGRIFFEEKRAMKEKFEKELKDARARELMYAEEVAMLEKEVKKERAKAAAALKSLQERLEQRLKMELEEKEREAQSKLKELQDFSKAELAASIAREKAAQVEKMAEADLNINALCMAFYARSEEARQTHSVHKLALGALALEDALSNGLPLKGQLDVLNKCVDGVDKDSLLQLALSSLPEDVQLHGTDSPLQLHQKFDALKGALRHFSLIPPQGGGILAHSLAHVASFLKVKEGDQSGDGIESLINKVERLLAEGKLVEAANALEDGVKDSKAAEVASDWLKRARNRAIAEQALVLLQSYATSVSLS